VNSVSKKSKILFVVGPTASGKSDLAVRIAVETRSRNPYIQPQIINCDSVLFFSGVEIGAAKPSAEQLQAVPHHLLSHISPLKPYSAGDFRRDALNLIAVEEAKGHRHFIAVGGSGFHIQALEKGMFDVKASDLQIRSELEGRADKEGLASLHQELASRDPVTAGKIHSADRYRIMRALEILKLHPEDENLTVIRDRFESQREAPPFDFFKLGVQVPRTELRQRVIARTQLMLKAGFVSEVETLRALGLADTAPLRSVGYKEVQAFLNDELPLSELENSIVTGTMQLAKRQMTWFRRDPKISWYDATETKSNALEEALIFLGS
jgi:tRNA dimethylallyltransferase